MLLRGRLTRLTRFSVCVSHGSTLEPRTTLTDEALGAKAAAEAGKSWTGILSYEDGISELRQTNKMPRGCCRLHSWRNTSVVEI